MKISCVIKPFSFTIHVTITHENLVKAWKEKVLNIAYEITAACTRNVNLADLFQVVSFNGLLGKSYDYTS